MTNQDYGRPISEVWLSDIGGVEAAVPDILEAVVLYPVGAPLPPDAHKLAGDPSTPLYERLAALAKSAGPLSLCPLSGPELHSLVTSWPNLVGRKTVYSLIGLPGQLVDPVFAEAARAIGLKQVAWADIAREVETARTQAQSDADAHPWAADGSFDFGKPAVPPEAQDPQPADVSRPTPPKAFASRRTSD